jgi:GDP-D-mannose dehydratase
MGDKWAGLFVSRGLIAGVTGQDGSYLAELLLGTRIRGARVGKQHEKCEAHWCAV